MHSRFDRKIQFRRITSSSMHTENPLVRISFLLEDFSRHFNSCQPLSSIEREAKSQNELSQSNATRMTSRESMRFFTIHCSAADCISILLRVPSRSDQKVRSFYLSCHSADQIDLKRIVKRERLRLFPSSQTREKKVETYIQRLRD